MGGVSAGTFTFDTTGHTYGSMGWTTITVNGLTAAGPSTDLRFSSLDDLSSAWGPALDNVSVVAQPNGAVPEPSQTATFAFGAFAILGMLAFARKRRASSTIA